MPVIIVGIGGISRSGKSSVSRALVKAIPNSIYVRQDSYLTHPKSVMDPKYGQILNWEDVNSYDLPKLVKNIVELRSHWISKTTVLTTIIVEGFLIFANEDLAMLFNKSVLIDIPMDVAFQRRMATKKMSDNIKFAQYYSEHYIWDSFKKFNQFIPKDTLVIDGCKAQEEVYKIVQQFIT